MSALTGKKINSLWIIVQISSATSKTFSLKTFFSTPVAEVRRWNNDRLPLIKIETAADRQRKYESINMKYTIRGIYLPKRPILRYEYLFILKSQKFI